MNCKFTNVIVFAVGAAIGSAVTYAVMKPKYERIIQEEVDALKKDFIECMTDMQDTDDEEPVDEDEERPRQIDWADLEDLDEEDDFDPDAEELNEYAEIIKHYANEEGGAVEVAKDPYVISPYDFDEMDGYKTVSLTYYSDKILENEEHKIVTNIDRLIGTSSLNTFGEYEDDSVFVRNERLRTDFEILKDYRTYTEATGKSPDMVAD